MKRDLLLGRATAGLIAVLLAGTVVAGGTPTIVDPQGPNSGAGRIPWTGEPASGPGRGLSGETASGPGYRLP